LKFRRLLLLADSTSRELIYSKKRPVGAFLANIFNEFKFF
jgi:hypothetical protein